MTQKEAVLQHIKDNGSITPKQAIEDLGITKLATVISNLRLKDGVEIKKEPVKVKTRYEKSTIIKRYSFPSEEENDNGDKESIYAYKGFLDGGIYQQAKNL